MNKKAPYVFRELYYSSSIYFKSRILKNYGIEILNCFSKNHIKKGFPLLYKFYCIYKITLIYRANIFYFAYFIFFFTENCLKNRDSLIIETLASICYAIQVFFFIKSLYGLAIIIILSLSIAYTLSRVE